MQVSPEIDARRNATGSAAAVADARRTRRADLIFGLGAVALLNAVAGHAAEATARQDVAAAALQLFGADPVSLTAAVIALVLCARGRQAGPAKAGDLAMAAAVAALLLLPHQAAGWVAMGGLGLWAMIAGRGHPPLAAAGVVFLAVSVHEAWGRVILAVVTPWLTHADAALAAGVLSLFHEGVSRTGNLIDTAGGYRLVVVASCTALPNVIQGVVAALALTRAVRPAWKWSELALWAAIAAAIEVLNVGRLVLFGLDFSYYRDLHAGPGGALFGVATLTVAIALTGYAVRNEFPARARR